MSASDLEEDIKATAEDLIADADRLRQIEQKKLALKPSDPKLARLADEAERIIERMAPKIEVQTQLASETETA